MKPIRLPRHLPLARVRLRDEDGDPIPAGDIFDELTALDVGSYDLERGVILFRRRGRGPRVYAVRTKRGRAGPFRALSDEDARAWIACMISPIRSAHAWRLKIAIHALRVARRSIERADIALDALTSHDSETIAGRPATKKWRAVFEKKIREAAYEVRLCLRAEAHAIWLIRYLLRQRARLRLPDAQLSLPFPE